ncbi:uncharacterized protein LOC108839471 [Raphanus sativus]|uniref:Uncharacterized protein LOC108839471 n=1 Tax=Raphanus sativus TaxID=3726 RepID=A0A9W3DEJ8_RAPSA|nr:uncharacterized protein LOC108839471 [Raphanus sativus]
MVVEDFDMEEDSLGDLEFIYLPTELINTSTSPPVIIANNRQLKNFLGYVEKSVSTLLCLTSKAKGQNPDEAEFDLNMSPSDSSDDEEESKSSNRSDEAPVFADTQSEEKKEKDDGVEFDEDAYEAGTEICETENIDSKLNSSLLQVVKTGQHFESKTLLKATFEICAMKHNFDYQVIKTDRKVWYVRCADDACSWSVRATCLKDSKFCVIKKYVGQHSCAPSSKTKACKTASAKTIGSLIMHKYEGVKEGPKSLDAREYAINAVRGIPERSYGKIPKYLHMLREANPGTHSAYEMDGKGRFQYLFIAFGQSIRGFKRVMRQLKLVIDDDRHLAFISDRHGSIVKGLKKVYPEARHGICIHHLLNNVVTYYHGKGLVGLVSKASKTYRVADFDKTFANVCNISLAIGKYLRDADVQKWARCQFPGYRYDLRTTNPAESINSALRSPREFPLIPLLDSIREMLTRWFYKRKKLIAKHNHPLTKKVELKIARRTRKGATFEVYPVSEGRLLVRGDMFDCLVDLDRQTCSCGKFDLLKIPCRHAIKAGFHVGRQPHTLTDLMYTTGAWREAYQESINPIGVPEDAWSIPEDVKKVNVLPPETRKAAGRNRKRRYETVEDKI